MTPLTDSAFCLCPHPDFTIEDTGREFCVHCGLIRRPEATPAPKKPDPYEPCICGSGKRYKFCCLPMAQIAEREKARNAKGIQTAALTYPPADTLRIIKGEVIEGQTERLPAEKRLFLGELLVRYYQQKRLFHEIPAVNAAMQAITPDDFDPKDFKSGRYTVTCPCGNHQVELLCDEVTKDVFVGCRKCNRAGPRVSQVEVNGDITTAMALAKARWNTEIVVALKYIGTPDPYPESRDPSSPVVAPTADGLKL